MRPPLLWLTTLLVLLPGPPARPQPAGEGAAAADPAALPYTVEVTELPDSDLDETAARVAQTAILRERAPTDALGLLGRVRGDLPRLMDLLRSEGHWGGSVSATVAGRPVDDPGLPARLAGRTDPVAVVFTLAPGPQYAIGRVELAAEPPSAATELRAAAAHPGLAEGDPARAGAVLDAEAAIVDALRRTGHPLAAAAGREVTVDHDRRRMDVAWRIAPGPRATFDTPQVVGQRRARTALLERTAGRRLTGEPYSPETLERARRSLMALGVFESVRAEPAGELAPGNRLPVTFRVSERPLRAIGGSLSYETNYGPGASVYWEHRNLFGGAERLRLEAEAARLGETGAEDATYRAFATLTTPEFLGRDARLIAQVGAVRERLDAYDRDAFVSSALVEHPLTARLALQAGPSFETGSIGRYGTMDPFTLVGFTMGVRWDGTTSLLDPTSGQRAALTVTPYYSMEDGTTYTRILATGSTYFDLAGNGGSVLALRTALGSNVGATRDQITLDKRFYSGGGGSVRGFTYQSIGPRDRGNRPLGGASLVEVGAEWRQRVSGPWGAVGFVEAGSVGEESYPTFDDLRVGVGVGMRYQTAIGPIRFDIGVPLNAQRGDPDYAIYVGIGQAF